MPDQQDPQQPNQQQQGGQQQGQQPGSPQQPQAESDDSGAVKWILLLVGGGFAFLMCAGCLAAIAVPAFTKYLQKSKVSEAEMVLQKTRTQVSKYHATNGELPGLGQTVKTADQPPTGGNKYTPDPSRLSSDQQELWQTLGWTSDPKYFQYVYKAEKTDSGAEATLEARADFSEGGEVHTEQMTIKIRDGSVDISPTITMNEFE